MYQCRLRALTQDGLPYYFYACDVPVRVTRDRFILAAKPGSPVLLSDTVGRAFGDVAEGDLISSGGREYEVAYRRGFQCVSGREHIDRLPSEFVVVEHCHSRSARILYRYGGSVFRMQSFLGMYLEHAVVAGIDSLVPPDEIQVSAGFKIDGRTVFFGDDGLQLWCGRPCICQQGQYIEIPTGTIIGGAEDGSNSRCTG